MCYILSNETLFGDEKMKVGDRVTIKDHSWSRTFTRMEGLIHKSLSGGKRDTRYTVVEMGCTFPLGSVQPAKYRNDTVIQADDGMVVLIHSGFLELVDPPRIWEHGDVFKNHVGVWIYLKPCGTPRTFSLDRPDGDTIVGSTPGVQLEGATLLFNITDRPIGGPCATIQ
jgi:hypothetical protein